MYLYFSEIARKYLIRCPKKLLQANYPRYLINNLTFRYDKEPNDLMNYNNYFVISA